MPNSSRNEQLTEIVEKYMSELVGTDFANRTLARKIVDENPQYFENTPKVIESVRKAIRYRRNATGNKYRDRHPNAKLYERTEQKPSEYMASFMAKTNHECNKPKHWTLPQEHTKVLVMSDIHFPHHTMSALGAALDFGIQQHIDGTEAAVSNDVRDMNRRRPSPGGHATGDKHEQRVLAGHLQGHS